MKKSERLQKWGCRNMTLFTLFFQCFCKKSWWILISLPRTQGYVLIFLGKLHYSRHQYDKQSRVKLWYTHNTAQIIPVCFPNSWNKCLRFCRIQLKLWLLHVCSADYRPRLSELISDFVIFITNCNTRGKCLRLLIQHTRKNLFCYILRHYHIHMSVVKMDKIEINSKHSVLFCNDILPLLKEAQHFT